MWSRMGLSSRHIILLQINLNMDTSVSSQIYYMFYVLITCIKFVTNRLISHSCKTWMISIFAAEECSEGGTGARLVESIREIYFWWIFESMCNLLSSNQDVKSKSTEFSYKLKPVWDHINSEVSRCLPRCCDVTLCRWWCVKEVVVGIWRWLCVPFASSLGTVKRPIKQNSIDWPSKSFKN